MTHCCYAACELVMVTSISDDYYGVVGDVIHGYDDGYCSGDVGCAVARAQALRGWGK